MEKMLYIIESRPFLGGITLNFLNELLLNTLYLLLFLLIIPLLLELNLYRFYAKRRWLFSLSVATAILLCLWTPVEITEGYVFDLRLIALCIGGLYGGLPTITILIGWTALSRYLLIGGSGALATLIVLVILWFVLVKVHPLYQQAAKKKKTIIGSAVSLFAAALAFVNSVLVFNASFHLLFIVLFLIITVSVTALIVYLFEVSNEHIIMNRRIIRAERMEIVSHMAASVSHEIRNPLTAVRGFLQLMQSNKITEHQLRQYTNIALEEVDRANDIIQSYLIFAKPTVGQVKPLSIKDQIERALHIIEPLAHMYAIDIKVRIEDHPILGDEPTFQQCLINLIKNGMEAMHERGVLRIETSLIEGELLLEITDQGKGMTPEQLARVGEPYFTSKGHEGTGLGMMVAMKIIEAMRGKLTITSKLGIGTTVKIRLPVTKIIAS